jgi:hypothetical protein
VLQNEELELFLKTRDQTAALFNTETNEKILQVKNIILSEKNGLSFL